MKTTYPICKEYLLQEAKEAKKQFKNDLPAIRQCINDYSDYLSREYNLTEYQCDLLFNYACKLHEKFAKN